MLDVPTRWNSTYEMLKRAWELRTKINSFVPNDEKLKDCQISSSEWKKIEYLIAILKLVKDASQFLLGSEYITISSTLPTYIALLKVIIFN